MHSATLGSLFDGIGGFPFAGCEVGMVPMWSSEIDKVCMSITARWFPSVMQVGDITRLSGSCVPPVDIITGGSPCQDLSVAGNRDGLRGEKSVLFYEMVRFIREMREATDGLYPRIVVWENVVGALSSGGGADFRDVLSEFAGIAGQVSIPLSKKWHGAGLIVGDSFSVGWRVLDAQYFGVPQRRRRVFVVVDFGGERAGEILFEPVGVSVYIGERGAEGERVTAGVAEDIRTAGWTPTHGKYGIAYEEEKSPTVMDGKGRGACVHLYGNVKYGAFRCAKLASTLKSRVDNRANDCIVGEGGRYVRRLTPLEYERLQGYPDGYTSEGVDGEAISDNKRYVMLGNSVAVPCVRYLLGRVSTYLQK